MYDTCTYFDSHGRRSGIPTISIRELARRSSRVVDDVVSSGRPAIITRRGKPVSAMIAIDPDELEDFVLANAPEYAAAMRDADADVKKGRFRSAAEVFDELKESKPAR